MQSFPEAFIKQLESEFPEQAPTILEGLNQEPVTSIQINSSKLNTLNLPQVVWNNLGFYLPERPSYVSDPLFHAGAYYPMEASSMFVGYLLDQILKETPNPLVLDLCAAPGGKSISVLNKLNGAGFLVANEIHPQRSTILKENITKWGHGNILVTNNSVDDFDENQSQFDVVVVDAPCSGEGMFRKDPYAINEWSVENINTCVLRQQNILEHAIELIKPNGYLIYSTCTFNRSENEHQIEILLKTNQFEVVKIEIPESSKILKTEFGFRFFPGFTQGEGFACFLLRKLSGNTPKNKSKWKLHFTSPKIEWFKTQPPLTYHQFKEDVFGISNFEKLENFNPSKLRIKQLGIPIASAKGKLLLPHPLGVFSSVFAGSTQLEFFELDYNEALDILMLGQAFKPKMPRGWLTFSYNNIPMALAKNLGNRINNYFPKQFKIRIPKEQLSNFSISNYLQQFK